MKRPHIILLVLDSQRADRMSRYGRRRPTWPFLDEVCERTTLFTGAIVPAQWTVPAHASPFITPNLWQYGVQQLHRTVAQSATTEVLRRAFRQQYGASVAKAAGSAPYLTVLQKRLLALGYGQSDVQ